MTSRVSLCSPTAACNRSTRASVDYLVRRASTCDNDEDSMISWPRIRRKRLLQMPLAWDLRMTVPAYLERRMITVTLAETDEFAVGMRIAAHPPHRSERAQFRHSAPTSGGERRSVGRAKGAGCAAAGAKQQQAAETDPM
jgi:hypothetical protein